MKQIKNYKESKLLKMTYICRKCECFFKTDEIYYREAIEMSKDKKEKPVLIMLSTCPICGNPTICGEDNPKKISKLLLEIAGKGKVHGNTKRKIKQI